MIDLVAKVKALAAQASLNVCQHRYGWDVYTRQNVTIFSGNLREVIDYLTPVAANAEAAHD